MDTVNKTEVFDLNDAGKTCVNLVNFPDRTNGQAYGWCLTVFLVSELLMDCVEEKKWMDLSITFYLSAYQFSFRYARTYKKCKSSNCFKSCGNKENCSISFAESFDFFDRFF